jgi:hypothetical protein
MIIPGQFGFNYPSGFREEAFWNIFPIGQMPSSQKLQIWLKPNCTWMFIRWSSTNCTFFVPVWNSKWRLRPDLGGGHLGFPIGIKNTHLVEDLPMIISGQFGFNYPSGFREEAFWNIFPIGSNVKLSPAVAAILNQTVHECSLDGPLQTLRFLFWYEIQNGSYGRT